KWSSPLFNGSNRSAADSASVAHRSSFSPAAALTNRRCRFRNASCPSEQRQRLVTSPARAMLSCRGFETEMDDKSNEDRGHVERDQLYEQVWAEPVTKVAVRYGIS